MAVNPPTRPERDSSNSTFNQKKTVTLPDILYFNPNRASLETFFCVFLTQVDFTKTINGLGSV